MLDVVPFGQSGYAIDDLHRPTEDANGTRAAVELRPLRNDEAKIILAKQPHVCIVGEVVRPCQKLREIDGLLRIATVRYAIDAKGQMLAFVVADRKDRLACQDECFVDHNLVLPCLMLMYYDMTPRHCKLILQKSLDEPGHHLQDIPF
jgi:hypothetical protein